MRLGRYLDAGLVVGLGSDVSAGPDLSLFGVMRAGAYTQSGLRTMLDEPYPELAPMDWLRLGSLQGARALGLDDAIGSVEEGKEADLIAIDTALTAPVPGGDASRAGGDREPTHLPLTSQHGSRCMGSRPAARGTAGCLIPRTCSSPAEW